MRSATDCISPSALHASPRSLHFNDCMARRICAKEMHGCSTVRMVRIKCSQLEITRIVRTRSEEHTSELQSRLHLVCRLLLEKKKKLHKNTELCPIFDRPLSTSLV